MKSPLISAVIPTYNCASVLRMCLNSVKTQEYPDDRLQILIVDGGSTDGTPEVFGLP
jgi:glycosyltransferase involved in cell wall biosynthesis